MDGICQNSFIDEITKIREEHKDNCIIRNNGTILLNPMVIPKCRHMLFKPLDDSIINEFLCDVYEYNIPNEYIEFLKQTNGANLYYVKLKSKKYSFACCQFIMFGLPRTKPFGRPLDMEEPYDIRIEDLSRHKNIPETWLKCGRYIKDCKFDDPIDIFIDTISGAVNSYKKDTDEFVNSWSSLNQCFCEILDSLSMSEIEYLR